MSADVSIVDFKSAFQQFKIKTQLVEYKQNKYCLTRLGFGLNCIMSKILKSVIARNECIKGTTNSYIDEILVDELRVSSNAIVEYLKKY